VKRSLPSLCAVAKRSGSTPLAFRPTSKLTARKCYQDVLNEKHTRDFKGKVTILLSLTTSGTAKAVKIMGGTLKNKEVEDCLVSTVKEFEFPKLDRPGDIQYDYTFEPQY
jgi:hypothetical protein